MYTLFIVRLSVGPECYTVPLDPVRNSWDFGIPNPTQNSTHKLLGFVLKKFKLC